jgi:hypothetical protein
MLRIPAQSDMFSTLAGQLLPPLRDYDAMAEDVTGA